METILSVHDLRIQYEMQDGIVKALNGVDFELEEGSSHGLVGETGAGKTTMAKGIMGLTPKPYGKIKSGEILYHGKDLLKMSTKELRKIRGEHISMIFQDPMTALNPVFTVGYQIDEALLYHGQAKNRREADKKAVELLKDMGIPLPEQRVKEYPHQFSGGMSQRAMIAMAMSCRPKVLVADEPTTALDVTIQAQIFELMLELKDNNDTAILLITHDMGVVAELADDVAVMYMGNIVESGDARAVLTRPSHPYTKALLDSIPVLGRGKKQKLMPIKGSTPDPYDRPKGCQFAPRCPYASEECEARMPGETLIEEGHMCRCFHDLMHRGGEH